MIATALVTLIAATPAHARPLQAKRERARAVKSQIDALDRKLEVAAEDYNEAYDRYTGLSRQVSRTQTKLNRVKKRVNKLQTHLRTRTVDMYRTGPTQFLEMLLGAADFEQFASTWDLLRDMNESDAEAAAELKVVRREMLAVQKKLKAQKAEARKNLNVMNERKASIQADLDSRKRMLAGIESEIRELEAAEEAAARAAAARARRSAPFVSRGADYGVPTNAPRSGVVGIAMQYLGRPYRWAAAGPDSFDCSGFTMYVYRQVGVSLPHSSRAQFGSGQHVSRANLQPGDLVFFGSPIHHVGIYVGGGSFIHSPRTGDVVKISPLSRMDYVGAVRP